MGGSLPGDELLQANGETPEQIAAHPHPFYTPIGTLGSDYLLEPVAYGLKIAGSFSGGTSLKTGFSTQLPAAGVSGTAYVEKLANGQTSIIIETSDAAALNSRDAHITTTTKTDSLKQTTCSVVVPHATGLRVTLL